MPFRITDQNLLVNNDKDESVELGITLPWSSSPEGSYLYYDCTLGTALDSGIVIHNRLPQVDRTPDSLGVVPFDDPRLNTVTEHGVNLRCQDQYKDIVQRMAHSRYWFRLWGMAIRVGYKVPIPVIKSIGGVPAIPYDRNPQWAYNKIAPGGNYNGIILWLAEWSLWFTTAVQPVNNSIPSADPSALINNDDINVTPPRAIQAPFSKGDLHSKPGSSPASILGNQGKPFTR